MTTTFVTVTGGADTYWRAELPSRHLGAQWLTIPATEAQRAFGEPNRDTSFPWYPWIEGRWFFPSNDVFWDSFDQTIEYLRYPKVLGSTVVFTRPDGVRAQHALAFQEQGKTTIAEIDDTLLSDPFLNIFMRINQFNEATKLSHMKTFAIFDRIVFSTEWLRDEYHRVIHKKLGKEMRKRGIRFPELHVCRNHADLDDWPTRVESSDGRLRVGWMGSAQHYRDVKQAYGALHLAQQSGAQIYMVGANFADIEGVTNKRAMETTLRWAMLNPTTIPWVDPEEYHRTPLPFDIGVVPLERNRHTMGKSDIKAIEYTMSGAAVIAQAHPVYTKHWVHNETCLLANSSEEFAEMMKALIEQPKLRERLVEAAQQYVREERTMQRQGREEWEQAVAASTSAPVQELSPVSSQ